MMHTHGPVRHGHRFGDQSHDHAFSDEGRVLDDEWRDAYGQPYRRTPAVGEVWERSSDGRALVRIGRVFTGNFAGVNDHWVRCHPVRGGKVWLTTVTEFLSRYTPHSGGYVAPHD